MNKVSKENLVRTPKYSAYREVLVASRFGIVGVTATAVHMLIVWLLIKNSSLPLLLANLFAFLTAFIISFTGNYLWTFGSTGDAKATMGRFFIISATALAVNSIILTFLTQLNWLPRSFAVTIAAAIIPLITYLASRLWVFKIKSNSPHIHTESIRNIFFPFYCKNKKSKFHNEINYSLWLGVFIIIASSWQCLSRENTIVWDAEDFWFPMFSWIGQSVRAGYWGDYFPFQFSGYPLGADLQAGIYNPIYLIFSILFPTSTLNINLVYLSIEILCYFFGFFIGRSLALSRISSFMLGLLCVGNGFFIGHSEHLSYLSSTLGFLILLYGYLSFLNNKSKSKISLYFFLGSWQLFTAGYPALLLAQAYFFTIVIVFIAFYSPRPLSNLLILASTGTGLAVLISSPALIHFFFIIHESTRSEPLDVNVVLNGSLPLNALARFAVPWSQWKIPDIDISMDRFHLLVLSPLLLLFGIFEFRRRHGLFLLFAYLTAISIMLILILGDNSHTSLRRWLAETTPFFRFGRFPCSEFHFQILLLLSFLSALGLDFIQNTSTFRTIPLPIIYIIISLDFLATTSHLNYLRFSESHIKKLDFMYNVIFTKSQQSALDSPRVCYSSFEPEIRFFRKQNERFSWWGYSPLIIDAYKTNRNSLQDILCQKGRLFNADTRKNIIYDLDFYSPSEIRFSITQNLPAKTNLVWTEVTDGFWELKINEKPQDFKPGPGNLRYFELPETTSKISIRMQYRSPIRRMLNM